MKSVQLMAPVTMGSPGQDSALTTALETVINACYGDDPAITLAYTLFQAVNARFFANVVPMPLIIRGLTPYSHGFSWLHVQGPMPILFLHPTLFGAPEPSRHHRKETGKVWAVPVAWLTPYLLGDVIVHECIHAHLTYNLGGASGPTSHNNDAWVAEVNRLLPLLGFHGFIAGRSKTVRVPNSQNAEEWEKIMAMIPAMGERPIEDMMPELREVLSRKRRPAPASQVKRITEGNLPFDAVAKFPVGIRTYLQQRYEATAERTQQEQRLLTANAPWAAAMYYTQAGLPFGIASEAPVDH